jgi:hypothetical protein
VITTNQMEPPTNAAATAQAAIRPDGGNERGNIDCTRRHVDAGGGGG